MHNIEPGVYQLRISYTTKDGSFAVDYAKHRCYNYEDLKKFTEGLKEFHSNYASGDMTVTHKIIGGEDAIYQ